jgi:hypothetical protein
MTSAVQKYRSFFKEKKLGSLSTVDMLALSKACLSATESAVGLKFDPGAYVVAAPNHYAVISKTTGFREINLAATHQP